VSIKVVELHHHGIRIGKTPEELEAARQFYTDVLGLETDSGRPTIPGISGSWIYVGNDTHTAQIHLMGVVGTSTMARSEKEDPTRPHVALAVEDIREARRELEQRGIWHWRIQGVVGPDSDQVFVQDPFGNVIELHQVGTCRCNKAAVKARSKSSTGKTKPGGAIAKVPTPHTK
jgi:catechol 2,3-dioxygenase-like lactoylglutathione lyase family enzyme